MLFMFAVLTTTPKMHVYQQVALSEVECRRDAELTELQDGVGKRTFLSLLLSSCACVVFLLTSTVQPHFSLRHTLPNSQCAAAGRSQSLTRLRHASPSRVSLLSCSQVPGPSLSAQSIKLYKPSSYLTRAQMWRQSADFNSAAAFL